MKKKFPYRYRVLILLFSLILITYLDRVCISLVGVRIKGEFKLSNEQFGWVLSAFALAYALFEIPSGILGDRIGQRKVLIRIVIWWSVFTALTGAATGLVTLMLTRFLFGMGEAGAYPNSSAAISKWFPRNETAKGMSSCAIGSNTGAALAPLIVVPLAIKFGWRAPFFVNGCLGLVWVLVCYLWFRDFPSQKKRVSAEELQHIEENRSFEKGGHVVSWSALLKNRNVWFLALMFMTSQWANYFFVGWMPIFLQEGKHFTENEMKMVTSLVFIVAIGGAATAGILSDWLAKTKGLQFGRRSIGFISLFAMAVLFLVTGASGNKSIVAVSLICAHFFLAPNVIVAFATCVDIGVRRAGTVAGIMNFFGQMGAFFLAIFFGKVADASHSFNVPVFVIAAILLCGSMLWFVIDPTKKISEVTREVEVIPPLSLDL